MRHRERHHTERIGWLRAAVLGANDGIVSTASLVVGVAAANSQRHEILLAGVTGLVSGALSMAAGEYVSVSSQADTERADLALEQTELATHRSAEEKELTAIYVERGLELALARTVALQLMAHDALGAHARDELGLSDKLIARPLQAALASAATFSVGAALPILTCTSIAHPAGPVCLRHLVDVPRRAGCTGGTRWRRVPMGRRRAGHNLEYPGDGGDRRHRGPVRDDSIVTRHAGGRTEMLVFESRRETGGVKAFRGAGTLRRACGSFRNVVVLEMFKRLTWVAHRADVRRTSGFGNFEAGSLRGERRDLLAARRARALGVGLASGG
jgi:vacuolar iron transporter family protein